MTMLQVTTILLGLGILILSVNGGMNLDNYQLTWDQDFTTMTKLNVSAWGSGTTWIAHTPYGGDWVRFMDPKGPYMPFNVGNGFLTIRVQNISGTMWGGLLASVDTKGNGFAQKNGYFEMEAKLPGAVGPFTWPAFWLDDVQCLKDKSAGCNGLEIDVLEEYSPITSLLHSTLHYWVRSDPKKDWGQGKTGIRCGTTSGFHTYGVDIQPDFLTFYYDRLAFAQFPNMIPGFPDAKFDREMYVMVNNAYMTWGGPGVMPGPQDLQVKYIKVWQGTGGSAKAFDTSDATATNWPTAALSMAPGDSVPLTQVTLRFTKDGLFQITENTNNDVLWQIGKSTTECEGNDKCFVHFQNDGNLVINAGSFGWASGTWGDNEGSMTFQNESPYLWIANQQCDELWSTKKTPSQF